MSASLLPLEVRARLLLRLAALLRREVPLAEALAALASELPARLGARLQPALAAAREGAALERALTLGELLRPEDAALVGAARGTDGAVAALELLGREADGLLEARTAVARALRLPLYKLVLLVALGAAIALVEVWQVAHAGGGADLILLIRALLGSWWLWVEPTLATPGDASLLSVGLSLVGHLAALGLCFGLGVLAARALLARRLVRRFLERVARDTPGLLQLYRLEASARLLRGLGTGLAAGAGLSLALRRAREGFGDRVAGDELDAAGPGVADGADLAGALVRIEFLDETARWVAAEAAKRPDPGAELLRVASQQQELLLRRLGALAPFLAGLADLGLAIPVLAGLLYMTSFAASV